MSSNLIPPPELADGQSWADLADQELPRATSQPAERDFSSLAPPPGRRARFGPSRRPSPVAGATPQPEPEPEPEHGHSAEPCRHCEQPDRCDCPCVVCTGVRRIAAGLEAVAHSRETPPSWAQQQLDRQWESANLGGAGCPFCDAVFGCGCWRERAEMHELVERQRVRDERAVIAAAIRDGKCYCDQLSQGDDYPEMCEICQREEELRCRECGQLQCRPECCGGCGGCSRCRGDPCKGCGGWESDCCCHDDREEDRESCGCGACEEHDGREEDFCY
jgi:hypothetical protein